jgi:hypothetical protein
VVGWLTLPNDPVPLLLQVALFALPVSVIVLSEEHTVVDGPAFTVPIGEIYKVTVLISCGQVVLFVVASVNVSCGKILSPVLRLYCAEPAVFEEKPPDPLELHMPVVVAPTMVPLITTELAEEQIVPGAVAVTVGVKRIVTFIVSRTCRQLPLFEDQRMSETVPVLMSSDPGI